MSKATKFLLALTGITFPAGFLFVTGVINVGALPGLHVVFPLGTIFFGMTLITFALEKEVASFDAEQRAREHSLTEESRRQPECSRDSNSSVKSQTDDWQQHAKTSSS